MTAGFNSLDDGRLRELLNKAHAGKSAEGEIHVGILCGERISSTHVGGSGNALFPLGCLAKVLTGMLSLRAQTEGRLDFTRELTELPLAANGDTSRHLTARELLNHSHGLDVSEDDRVPRSANGYIDAAELCGRIRQRPRLFAPGAFYSYSRAGAWLTAALLEQAFRTEFATLLNTKVLQPAGITRIDGACNGLNWCPATGGNLTLSVVELLQIVRWYFHHDELRLHAELQSPALPPGWCLERGACAGWKFYGDGWYGHNVMLGRQSLVLRAHPEEKVALLVAATDAAASLTTIRMFGRLLPEYRTLRIPKVLPEGAARADDEACLGTYANGARVVRVARATDAKQLEAEIRTPARAPDGGETVLRTKLTPGTNDAYLAEPTAAPFFQWIQFVPVSGQTPSHLWDGREVLRRLESSDPSLSEQEIQELLGTPDPEVLKLLGLC